MIRRALILTLSAGLLVPAAEPLAAQAWDTPSFLAPRPLKELGLSLVVPEDTDWGLVGYFRQPRVIENTVNLGFRAGYLKLDDRDRDDIIITIDDLEDLQDLQDDLEDVDDLDELIEVLDIDDFDGDRGSAAVVGFDAYGMLMSTSDGDRVDLAWAVGLGGTFGDDVTEVRVPIGVTAGIGLPLTKGLTLYPYVYPRIGIDVDFEGETEGDTGLSLDVGADLGIGRNILLRLAGTVIDRPAWGIGLAWVRGPREEVTAN